MGQIPGCHGHGQCLTPLVNDKTIDQGSNSKVSWSFVFVTEAEGATWKILDLLTETLLI